MSFTSTVPASVPSLFQSSPPPLPPFAWKYRVPPMLMSRLLGSGEEAQPGDQHVVALLALRLGRGQGLRHRRLRRRSPRADQEVEHQRPPAVREAVAHEQLGDALAQLRLLREQPRGLQQEVVLVGDHSADRELVERREQRVGGEAVDLLLRDSRNADLITIAPPALNLRRAGFLADIGWTRLRENPVSDPASIVPIYVNQAGVPHP